MSHSGPREGLMDCVARSGPSPWKACGSSVLAGEFGEQHGPGHAHSSGAHLACPYTLEQPLSAVDRLLCPEATHPGPSWSPFPPQGPPSLHQLGPAGLKPTEALGGKAAPARWETEQFEPSLSPPGGTEPIFPRGLELLRPSVPQAGEGAAGSPASMARPWARSNLASPTFLLKVVTNEHEFPALLTRATHNPQTASGRGVGAAAQMGPPRAPSPPSLLPTPTHALFPTPTHLPEATPGVPVLG